MSSEDGYGCTPFDGAVMGGKYEEDGLIWLLDRYRICLTSYLKASIKPIRSDIAMRRQSVRLPVGYDHMTSYSYSEVLLQRLENLPPKEEEEIG
jgi:hypothetical protein